MAAVINREQTIIKQEDHLTRVTTAMFNKVTAADRDLSILNFFNSDLNEEIVVDESEENNEYKAVNAPVIVKKKDPKSRRKQREQKEIKQRLLKAKLEKKKVTDIHRYCGNKSFVGIYIHYDNNRFFNLDYDI